MLGKDVSAGLQCPRLEVHGDPGAQEWRLRGIQVPQVQGMAVPGPRAGGPAHILLCSFPFPSMAVTTDSAGEETSGPLHGSSAIATRGFEDRRQRTLHSSI